MKDDPVMPRLSPVVLPPAHMGPHWNTDVVVAHSLTDHTQSRWNGLIGQIQLQARPQIAIRHHRWQLDADLQHITLHLSLHNDALSN